MKQKTDHLKINPVLGRLPVLQYAIPGELHIDEDYQRLLDGTSLALVRRIAQHWDWGLCQPLAVSRREDGRLFVIDGQHRLAAARMRGDIAQLPCVVVEYANPAAEAASFVALNQSRKPLSPMELFKAAVASGDTESCAIARAMAEAGLSIAPHYNHNSWKPGMVANVAGLQRAWRKHGSAACYAAMRALALAWPGEALRFAGTIWPGLSAICADGEMEPDSFARLIALLGAHPQLRWRTKINRARADDPNLNWEGASIKVLRSAWSGPGLTPAPPPRPVPAPTPPAAPRPAPRPVATTPLAGRDPFTLEGKTAWCAQCEQRRTREKVAVCMSGFCKLKGSL